MTEASFDHDQLIKAGVGTLLDTDARLPLPPMLMFDRITLQEGSEGELGIVRAELDINPELWFFKCHFAGDPVMPGCLGLDALWQMLGFYQTWLGRKGKGRAVGVGEVRFRGDVTPATKLVEYGVDVQKVRQSRSVSMGFGDGWMKADGKEIYTARGLRVGLFQDTSQQ